MQNEHDIVAALVGLVSTTLGYAVFTPEMQRRVDEEIRSQWGGQEVYVKKHNVDPEARATEVRAKYNGRNRKELMAEHNISRSQFYRFINGG